LYADKAFFQAMEDMAGIRVCHGEDPKFREVPLLSRGLGFWALTLVILGLKLAEIYQTRATVFANMGIGDFGVVHVSENNPQNAKIDIKSRRCH